jgi:hypothetical protein
MISMDWTEDRNSRALFQREDLGLWSPLAIASGTYPMFERIAGSDVSIDRLEACVVFGSAEDVVCDQFQNEAINSSEVWSLLNDSADLRTVHMVWPTLSYDSLVTRQDFDELPLTPPIERLLWAFYLHSLIR